LTPFFQDFDKCKAGIIKRGEMFVEQAQTCRNTVAEIGIQFIRDGAVCKHFYMNKKYL